LTVDIYGHWETAESQKQVEKLEGASGFKAAIVYRSRGHRRAPPRLSSPSPRAIEGTLLRCVSK
jgi:hypothetical protein